MIEWLTEMSPRWTNILACVFAFWTYQFLSSKTWRDFVYKQVIKIKSRVYKSGRRPRRGSIWYSLSLDVRYALEEVFGKNQDKIFISHVWEDEADIRMSWEIKDPELFKSMRAVLEKQPGISVKTFNLSEEKK